MDKWTRILIDMPEKESEEQIMLKKRTSTSVQDVHEQV
jgi:hypothetical protein